MLTYRSIVHWVVFALGAALAWGLYGPALHGGQVKLGSPFRALLCVGIAYMAIGVVVPLLALASQGELCRPAELTPFNRSASVQP